MDNQSSGRQKVVTRFAPSPTGYLHIGGLRTALFNYLYARKMGGEFLLRIEDTDFARNSQDAAQAIVESFQWVGLEYDREIIYQSQRFQLYGTYIKQLLEENKAYYCYMSKEELENERLKAEADGCKWKYDNRYRDFSGTPPRDRLPVVRIKAPLDGNIEFIDGVKGRINIQAKELDDFVIARSDGSPTYNFVVAVDDALMGVSDVIRGDDHLSNTPKQLIIYHALGFAIPRFFHVPMILNPQGKKLSKRDGAMGVMDYKDLGYLPEALLNFLVRLGWSYGDEEVFSIQKLLEVFHPNDLNTSPSSYNPEKLLWLNHHYIKQADNKRLQTLISEFGIKQPEESPQTQVLFEQIKERSKTIKELAQNYHDVVLAPGAYDKKLLVKLDCNGVEILQNVCNLLTNTLQESHAVDLQEIQVFLQTFAQSYGIKLGQLMPLLRLAILGKSGGIGVAEAIYILGKDECIKRIKTLLDYTKALQ
ncbi:MAG: glutamate--tRNA ligase [Helicobacter sp.]|nr:glutamate--tRNA ligase [Helicobacter sp.]MDY5740597.1 glutamate--tRNA ligase [Helicobacter sp.]